MTKYIFFKTHFLNFLLYRSCWSTANWQHKIGIHLIRIKIRILHVHVHLFCQLKRLNFKSVVASSISWSALGYWLQLIEGHYILRLGLSIIVWRNTWNLLDSFFILLFFWGGGGRGGGKGKTFVRDSRVKCSLVLAVSLALCQSVFAFVSATCGSCTHLPLCPLSPST